jgi:hypothetical protein
MTLVKIQRAPAEHTVYDISRQCKLETIDMNPRKKQELLTDLQVFFGEGTEDYYCYQNGMPYRRGYIFYGPAGTGKKKLVYGDCEPVQPTALRHRSSRNGRYNTAEVESKACQLAA